MSDIVCRRCGWLTYAFETYCHVCGWNRWDNDHVSVPTLWCDLTVSVTSNTDVSDITELPSMEIPGDLCEEGEHDFRTDDAGYRYCIRCNRSLQAICDWYGHDTTGGRT